MKIENDLMILEDNLERMIMMHYLCYLNFKCKVLYDIEKLNWVDKNIIAEIIKSSNDKDSIFVFSFSGVYEGIYRNPDYYVSFPEGWKKENIPFIENLAKLEKQGSYVLKVNYFTIGKTIKELYDLGVWCNLWKDILNADKSK